MEQLTFDYLKKGDHNTEPLLSIQNLSVKVGLRQVITQLSVDFYKGDHVRITGENGTGKSTLLNAIVGLEPSVIILGHIYFEGKEITNRPTFERCHQGIGYMHQSRYIFSGLTVKENLTLALGEQGYELFKEHFSNWAEQIKEKQLAGRLSGGQQKKLGWAMSVLNDKKIFLLDEPRANIESSGVDFNILCDKKVLILEVEHI